MSELELLLKYYVQPYYWTYFRLLLGRGNNTTEMTLNTNRQNLRRSEAKRAEYKFQFPENDVNYCV